MLIVNILYSGLYRNISNPCSAPLWHTYDSLTNTIRVALTFPQAVLNEAYSDIFSSYYIF